MKTLSIILIALTLVSCGKPSSGGSDDSPSVTCSTANDLVKASNWQDTATNDVYGLSSCEAGQDCAYCNNNVGCGNSPTDFKINYDSGSVTIHYYFYNATKTGVYEVCGDEMTIKWNDGDEVIFNKVVE